MKILIVDDQELVLLSLEKCLINLGYEVITATNVIDAISKYEAEKPKLVIADVNMPLTDENNFSFDTRQFIEDEAGLEMVKYIKRTKNDNVPIMLLSGNIKEDIITRGFELGADDYMKKPLSLNEIGARVQRIIGLGEFTNKESKNDDRYILDNCIGVVIPCYNEEERLLSEEFRSFVRKKSGYHLCFVNDGSTDNTLKVLEELRRGYEANISIYNCEKNGGKAEAVRLGMLHLSEDPQFDFIGFLDADLSTDFEDFDNLVATISNSEYKVVSGSRMTRMGADITKGTFRAIISKIINFIIRITLGMDFNDTQCGAKIMSKEVVEKTFKTKFLTQWLFDVEIFMRMKKEYGLKKAKNMLCEVPLKRWIHADGSKLSFKDSVKIIYQILQIAIHYNLKS